MAEELEEEIEVGQPSKRRRLWKKEDICNTPLDEFECDTSEFIMSPGEYFDLMFPPSLLERIVHQTNLYAKQRDVNSSFTTNEEEMRKFVGILMYMGICNLPAIEDYWAHETRVPQVANVKLRN